jgi:hypothetical protein
MDDEERTTLPRSIWWAALGLMVLFVVGFIVSFYVVREKAKSEIAANTNGLTVGVASLENLDFAGAAAQFRAVAASSSDFQSVAGLFSMFLSGRNPVGAFVDLAKNFSTLSDVVQGMEDDAFGLLGKRTNGGIANRLEQLRDVLHGIDADVSNLSSVVSLANVPLSGVDILSLTTRLHAAETFLDAFTPWFASSAPHHILVLLENPSELRPGGGFLGSYADVTIANGTITDVAVHDIADVDANFPSKIIPPKPLWPEISKFRPADGNWFFDFPTSASETISLFEQSVLYAASGTSSVGYSHILQNMRTSSDTATSSGETFDGAIAITPAVVSDLLSVTGPVSVSSTLKGPATTFTSDNVVVQIQKIVQAGQALLRQSSGGEPQSATYPKQVLGNLMQAIFMKIASSTVDEQQALFGMAGDWIAKKDIMVYFQNPAFENFAASWGATGEVYNLPQNFEGDYLALADANVNGQKSDLYMAETLNFQSQIGADGTVEDHIILNRAHHGDASPYWWYEAPNQEYLQFFVSDDPTLANESGGLSKTIYAPVNFAKDGYATDPLIAAIESSTETLFGYPAVTTHEESGKQIFATWSRVAAGGSSTISLDYSHRLYMPVAGGTAYQFVFEKQPGANRSYDFEIDAPLGYVFAETGIAAWAYEASTTMPGRLIVDLTLQKL